MGQPGQFTSPGLLFSEDFRDVRMVFDYIIVDVRSFKECERFIF